MLVGKNGRRVRRGSGVTDDGRESSAVVHAASTWRHQLQLQVVDAASAWATTFRRRPRRECLRIEAVEWRGGIGCGGAGHRRAGPGHRADHEVATTAGRARAGGCPRQRRRRMKLPALLLLLRRGGSCRRYARASTAASARRRRGRLRPRRPAGIARVLVLDKALHPVDTTHHNTTLQKATRAH